MDNENKVVLACIAIVIGGILSLITICQIAGSYNDVQKYKYHIDCINSGGYLEQRVGEGYKDVFCTKKKAD